MNSNVYQSVFERIVLEIEKGVGLHRCPPRRRLEHPVLISQAESFFASTGAEIRRQGRPCYCSDTRRVFLPRIERQKDEALAIKTCSHLLVRWTGASHHLNRQYDGLNWAQRFGVERMAAEFGAAFLCADFGITADILPYAASYIATVGDAISAGSAEIALAAHHAEEAVTYLHSLQGR